MAQTSYSRISTYWYTVLPAALVAVGYYIWHSGGFLALHLRSIVQAVFRLMGAFFDAIGLGSGV
jgi:hypothetical protein